MDFDDDGEDGLGWGGHWPLTKPRATAGVAAEEAGRGRRVAAGNLANLTSGFPSPSSTAGLVAAAAPKSHRSIACPRLPSFASSPGGSRGASPGAGSAALQRAQSSQYTTLGGVSAAQPAGAANPALSLASRAPSRMPPAALQAVSAGGAAKAADAGAAPVKGPGAPLGPVAQPPRPRTAAAPSGSVRGLLPPLPGGVTPQTQMPNGHGGPRPLQPTQMGQPPPPSTAGRSPAVAAQPPSQQPVQSSSQPPPAGAPAAPRHRTLLNYALTVFPSRLAPLAPLGARLRSGSGAACDVGQTSAAASGDAIDSGGGAPAVLLSAESLQQLQSVAAAVQDALVKAGACGGAALTAADRVDAWRLSAACWEAAAAATVATPPGDTPLVRADEQSQLLHGLGSAIHEVASEPAAGLGAAVGGGCSGAQLLKRVRFFHQMGRAWLALGRCAPAGWFLVRAREGLGQLQAQAAEETAPGQRPRPKRARLAAPAGAAPLSQDGNASADVGADAEGVGEVGGTAAEKGGWSGVGGSEAGSGQPPWLGLGLGCEEYLQVEVDVLVESLRLALAEGQQALSANLRSQLRRLATSPHTPPGLGVATTLTCVAILTDAAAIRLGAGVADAAEIEAEVPLVSAGGSSSRQQHSAQQQHAHGDAMALLAEALDVVEAAAEAEGRRRAAGGNDGAATERLAALVETRQQVLRFLISTCLRTGSYQAALSYVRAFAEIAVPNAAEGGSSGNGGTGSGAAEAEAGLPLDVLLLSVQAHVKLGRVVEAAALVAARVQPHPACTPAAMKAAFSRLLDSAHLAQLSISMPHLTSCLLACLERCRDGQDATGALGGGPRAASPPGGGAWDAAAGAELVVQVSSALFAHEGSTAEQMLLSLLAVDEVVAAVCNTSISSQSGAGASGGAGPRGSPRVRVYGMLYARAAAAFQQAEHAGAARLFAAALLYASGGGGAPYCRTARMLSACYAALGQPGRALGYLDLAEAVEPHTAAHVLLRLRLVLALKLQAQAKAQAGGGGREEQLGEGTQRGSQGLAGWSRDAAAEEDAERAAGAQGRGAGAGTAFDGEAVQLVQQLPRCCDFELSHLAVAYDIAMRAQRFGVAVAATELAMRHLGPPPRQAAASAAAAAAAGNALHAAVALTRDCIAGRLAAAAQIVSGSANGGRRAAAAGAAGDGSALPQATGAAVLRDLRWLCCRLSSAVAAPLAAQAAQASLSWLRDVAVRLSYDALLSGDGAAQQLVAVGNESTEQFDSAVHSSTHTAVPLPPAYRGRPPAETEWRMAVAAMRVAQQLDSALLLQSAAAADVSTRGPGREELGQQQAASDAAQRQLQPVVVAVAAGMLESYATRALAATAAPLGPPAAGAALAMAPPPYAALVVEAQQLLEGCRCAGGMRSKDLGPSAAATGAGGSGCGGGGGGAAMRAAVLQLRFVAATFAQDEAEQRTLLQALVDEPAVCGRRLEALASLCLAPDAPWHCSRPGCALLSFCIRKELPAPPTPAPGGDASQSLGGSDGHTAVDVELVARAIRRLYIEGSPDLRLIVCKRAVEVATQLHAHGGAQPAAAPGAALGPAAAASAAGAACYRYPLTQLHFLWTACLNTAIAEALRNRLQEVSAMTAAGCAGSGGASGELLLELASGLRQLEDDGAENASADLCSGHAHDSGDEAAEASALQTVFSEILLSVAGRDCRGRHRAATAAAAAVVASPPSASCRATRRQAQSPLPAPLLPPLAQATLRQPKPAELSCVQQHPLPQLSIEEHGAAAAPASAQAAAPEHPTDSPMPSYQRHDQDQRSAAEPLSQPMSRTSGPGQELCGVAASASVQSHGAQHEHEEMAGQKQEEAEQKQQTTQPPMALEHPPPRLQQPRGSDPGDVSAVAERDVQNAEARPPRERSCTAAGAEPTVAAVSSRACVPASPCSEGTGAAPAVAASDAAAQIKSSTAAIARAAAPAAASPGKAALPTASGTARQHHASGGPSMAHAGPACILGLGPGTLRDSDAGEAEQGVTGTATVTRSQPGSSPRVPLLGEQPQAPEQEHHAQLDEGVVLAPAAAAVAGSSAPQLERPPSQPAGAARQSRVISPPARLGPDCASLRGSCPPAVLGAGPTPDQGAAVQRALSAECSQASQLSECYGGQPDPALASQLPLPVSRRVLGSSGGGGEHGVCGDGGEGTSRGGAAGWHGQVLPMLPEGRRDATQAGGDAGADTHRAAVVPAQQVDETDSANLATAPADETAAGGGGPASQMKRIEQLHTPQAAPGPSPPQQASCRTPASNPAAAAGSTGSVQGGPGIQAHSGDGTVADEDDLSPLPEQADPLERSPGVQGLPPSCSLAPDWPLPRPRPPPPPLLHPFAVPAAVPLLPPDGQQQEWEQLQGMAEDTGMGEQGRNAAPAGSQKAQVQAATTAAADGAVATAEAEVGTTTGAADATSSALLVAGQIQVAPDAAGAAAPATTASVTGAAASGGATATTPPQPLAATAATTTACSMPAGAIALHLAAVARAALKPAAARPQLSDSDIDLGELDAMGTMGADRREATTATVGPGAGSSPTPTKVIGTEHVPAPLEPSALSQHAIAVTGGGAKRVEGPAEQEEQAAKRARVDAAAPFTAATLAAGQGGAVACQPEVLMESVAEAQAEAEVEAEAGGAGGGGGVAALAVGSEYVDEADALMLEEDW